MPVQRKHRGGGRGGKTKKEILDSSLYRGVTNDEQANTKANELSIRIHDEIAKKKDNEKKKKKKP